MSKWGQWWEGLIYKSLSIDQPHPSEGKTGGRPSHTIPQSSSSRGLKLFRVRIRNTCQAKVYQLCWKTTNILSAPECDHLPVAANQGLSAMKTDRRLQPPCKGSARSIMNLWVELFGNVLWEQRGLFRVHYHVSEPAGSGSGVANKAGKGWLGYGCELIHNMGLGLHLHEIWTNLLK